MITKIAGVFLVASLMATGCSKPIVVPTSTTYKSNWSQLTEGITKQEVLDLIGEPEHAVNNGKPNAIWYYGVFEMNEDIPSSKKAYAVYFENGKVSKFKKAVKE